MKVIIVALALVAIAVAAPAPAPVEQLIKLEFPKILRSEYEQKPNGGYSFGFESDDGTSKSEQGEIKEVLNEKNEPQQVVVVRGSFSYLREDGTVETINYVADEFGFHPEGKSIPVPVQAVSRR